MKKVRKIEALESKKIGNSIKNFSKLRSWISEHPQK